MAVQPVRFASCPQMYLAGLRVHHDLGQAHRTIPAQWEAFRANPPVPRPPGADAFGVVCGHSAAQLEYMCAFEVVSLDGLPATVGKMIVPAQHYAVFLHEGPAWKVGEAWSGILAWLSGGEYESAETPDFEVYAPDFKPGASESRVEIWVGVRPRAAR